VGHSSRFLTKVVEFTIKLTVPVKLPVASTCAAMVVSTVSPFELLMEPLKTPFASTDSDIVPLIE
jgi:hypothetical protein